MPAPHDEAEPGAWVPRPEDYAPFTPRAAKFVATIAGVFFIGTMVLLAVSVPGQTWFDRAAFLGLGLAVGWLLSRFAGVRATPSPHGLVVRNLLRTTTLEWPQIVSVRFGDRPWPQLDLSDGDVLSVLGIQRADGPSSQQEAVRLANLVEVHGTAR